MKRSLLILATALFIFTSCSENKKNDQNKVENNEPQPQKGDYSLLSTTVSWTAFKTNDKIGVGGAFDSVSVSNINFSDDPLEVLKGASFSIPVNSTNTNNPDRDYKIANFFFGVLTATENITGSVIDFGDSLANISLKLNDIEKNIKAPFTWGNDNVITINTTIDVLNWEAGSGIDSLNNKCYELHKGADGESKLWSEVDVEVKVGLKLN